jgi:hypothetical protein
MKTYARIDNLHGVNTVMEIIKPMVDEGGNEIPIEQRFTAELVETLVEVTNVSPQPGDWWTYDGKVFSPPAN